MQIGSEGKEFSLLLDTGSHDTWVTASSCMTPGCDTRPGLGPGNSKTLNVTNANFFVQYTGDRVSGKIAKDYVTLAGLTVEMSFGLATQVPITLTQLVHTFVRAV
jgi:cathepsin D